jgi:glycerophosphoryl diester phosphodiesterase
MSPRLNLRSAGRSNPPITMTIPVPSRAKRPEWDGGHDLCPRCWRSGGVGREPGLSSLTEVLKAFPNVPINVEIKGRTKKEAVSEYLDNARVLARLLRGSHHPDLIVVSFKQAAVDVFHQLAPRIDLAPGVDGAAAFLLGGVPLGPGTVAMQMPITYKIGGQTLEVTSPENVRKSHETGIAWQTWLSGNAEDDATTWRTLIGECVDGIMTSRPVALERLLKADNVKGPGRPGTEPCPGQ